MSEMERVGMGNKNAFFYFEKLIDRKKYFCLILNQEIEKIDFYLGNFLRVNQKSYSIEV